MVNNTGLRDIIAVRGKNMSFKLKLMCLVHYSTIGMDSGHKTKGDDSRL